MLFIRLPRNFCHVFLSDPNFTIQNEMSSLPTWLLCVFGCLLAIGPVHGRKHHLVIESDLRRFFPISNFGFYKGGFLAVNVSNFQPLSSNLTSKDVLGFSIDKTSSDALNSYVEASENECILDDRHKLLPSSQFEKDAIFRYSLSYMIIKMSE